MIVKHMVELSVEEYHDYMMTKLNDCIKEYEQLYSDHIDAGAFELAAKLDANVQVCLNLMNQFEIEWLRNAEVEISEA